MDSFALWDAYIRPIGAGAVATAGLFTLGRTIPTIVRALRGTFAQLKSGKAEKPVAPIRTEHELPGTVIFGGSLAMILIVWALLAFQVNPGVSGNFVASILVVIFGFLFVTVSARIVGLIGSSANPISGMTIATLMLTSLIFVAVGWTSGNYPAVAISIGGIVCIAAAVGGATSQSLKTGFLVGATPRKAEIAMIVGAITSVLVIGFTLVLLNRAYSTVEPRVIENVTMTAEMQKIETVTHEGKTYDLINVIGSPQVRDGRYYYDPATQRIEHQVRVGIGSTELPAPQAVLMSTVINGILRQSLPWRLVLLGVFIVVVVELLGMRSLAFAVGSYLPISTTAPIFMGGVVSWLLTKATKREEGEVSSGALFAAGLIAGGSIGGLIQAGIVGFKYQEKLAIGTKYFPEIATSSWIGLLVFLAMAAVLFTVGRKKLE
jgi:uncharacterized oligopeptide transporter (OPT) family protein